MNKIPLLILLVSFGFQRVFGQEFAIEHYKLNYAYIATGNPLNVVVENESCENIIVKTDNGTVVKRDSSVCYFEFSPETIGHAKLSVYVVKNADTTKIGERIYSIKGWPEHKPYFGRLSSDGEMSRAEFLANYGVRVPIQMRGAACGRGAVTSYKVTVVRKCESIYNLENAGGRLEEDNYEILRNVEVGDTVLISDVKAKMPGQVDVLVSNLRIEIVK